ncbi:amino acid/amide ABC transporter membrane protein 1, HAAT family [Caballeronia arationis]|uniref:Amino acid/amide ABC transporter membrane protein 1, HAAT family n=1 Tax=Caballeronia arationis TaxID=1777142 RepID=A0A7Z7N058_9BURK|nr:branched-chain amino acid ABC transporter permease [Caballeronia arationis]SOE45981.1 amino acid/amide ABC transporter membrane protein 1, HAAT family [Caballeronia arationis]
MTELLQALISGLAVGGAYALVALGFNITFTTTKTLNFSHGDFVSAGAFAGLSALLILLGKPINGSLSGETLHGWQQGLAVLAVIAFVGLLGALIYAVAVRPFAGKLGMSWVMSTIGFGIILRSAGLAIWGPGTMTVPAPLGDSVIRVFGAGIRPQELLVLVVALLVMVAFDAVMRKTMIGKAMRAVAHNKHVASLMGINVTAVMVGAFFVSSALAGLSGVLLAPITSVSIFMGLMIGLKGFSGAIIGGLSSPRGCVFGGFLLGVLESLVNLWQAQWREIVVFLLVILVLAIRPNGLLGAKFVEKV